MNNKYDAFISYSRRDNDIVQTIIGALKDKGIRLFFDIDDLLSGDFAKSIEVAISQSSVFVQFYSASAAQSNWISNEIKYSKNKGLPLLMVMLDDTLIPADTHPDSVIRVDRNNFDESVQHIEHNIIELLSKLNTSSVAPTHTAKESTPTPQPDFGLLWQRYMKSKKRNIILFAVTSVICILLVILIILSITFSPSDSCPSGIAPDVGSSIGDNQYLYSLQPSFLKTTLTHVILLIGLIIVSFIYFRHKEYTLKLFCDSELDSDVEIQVDGEVLCATKIPNVVNIRRKSGNYIITVSPKSNDLKGISFKYCFTRKSNKEIKEIVLPLKKEESPNNIVKYKCFIGGSTTLTSERNAVRAALGQLYNKWEDERLIVSAFTFEDFSNAQHQQERYFNFISNEAKCTIFIIDDVVGPKTLDEYRLAYATYCSLKTRPMIFVYANEMTMNPSVAEFKKEVLNNNSYWRNYKDIESLMSGIRLDIDAELFAIFRMGLKK